MSETNIQKSITYTCPRKYFKCPGLYCLPWRLVCNGKWECPGGTDEMQCNNRRCPGKIRCKNSSICISRESLCDSIYDCHLQEDEHFCGINQISNDCPINCSCLLYSIKCENGSLARKDNLKRYASITLKYVKFLNHRRNSILDVFGDPIIIDIKQVEHIAICKQDRYLKSLQILDISGNSVDILHRNCLKCMDNIRAFNVSKNILRLIESYTFNSSGRIQQLDLSQNNLRSLLTHSFSGLVNLISLNLSKNGIVSVSMFSFLKTNIGLIITENFQVCCFKPSLHTSCPVEPLWPHSCGRLLADRVVKVFILLVSSLGIGLNLFASVIIFKKRLIGGKSYDNFIICLSLSDIMCCTSLLIIVTADKIFSTQYLEYEYHWRTNIFCYISCILSIFGNLLSVFAISFLTVTRYLVVRIPVEVKIHDSKLSRICSLSIVLIFIFSISMPLLYFQSAENQQLPTGLCLLLGHGDKSIIAHATTILIILSQSISCVTIPILYYSIIHALHQQIHLFEEPKVSHLTKGNIMPSVFVALTNLVCWIPSSILLCMTLLWKEYPYVLLIWTTMVIVPLNCIINPFVFVYFNILKHSPWSKFRIWAKSWSTEVCLTCWS